MSNLLIMNMIKFFSRQKTTFMCSSFLVLFSAMHNNLRIVKPVYTGIFILTRIRYQYTEDGNCEDIVEPTKRKER